MEKMQVVTIIVGILIVMLVLAIVAVITISILFDDIFSKLSSKKEGMGVDNKPFSPDNTLLHMNPWDNINYIVPTVKTFYNEKVWENPEIQSYDIDMKAYSNYL